GFRMGSSTDFPPAFNTAWSDTDCAPGFGRTTGPQGRRQRRQRLPQRSNYRTGGPGAGSHFGRPAWCRGTPDDNPEAAGDAARHASSHRTARGRTFLPLAPGTGELQPNPLATFRHSRSQSGPHLASYGTSRAVDSERQRSARPNHGWGLLPNAIQIKRAADQKSRNPLNYMVAGEGIEPPTRGFSIPCSTN